MESEERFALSLSTSDVHNGRQFGRMERMHESQRVNLAATVHMPIPTFAKGLGLEDLYARLASASAVSATTPDGAEVEMEADGASPLASTEPGSVAGLSGKHKARTTHSALVFGWFDTLRALLFKCPSSAIPNVHFVIANTCRHSRQLSSLLLRQYEKPVWDDQRSLQVKRRALDGNVVGVGAKETTALHTRSERNESAVRLDAASREDFHWRQMQDDVSRFCELDLCLVLLIAHARSSDVATAGTRDVLTKAACFDTLTDHIVGVLRDQGSKLATRAVLEEGPADGALQSEHVDRAVAAGRVGERVRNVVSFSAREAHREQSGERSLAGQHGPDGKRSRAGHLTGRVSRRGASVHEAAIAESANFGIMERIVSLAIAAPAMEERVQTWMDFAAYLIDFAGRARAKGGGLRRVSAAIMDHSLCSFALSLLGEHIWVKLFACAASSSSTSLRDRILSSVLAAIESEPSLRAKHCYCSVLERVVMSDAALVCDHVERLKVRPLAAARVF